MSKKYTITLTDAEDKALSTVVFSQKEWIENFTKERCRIAIDEIVTEIVNHKLSVGEPITGSKDDLIMGADLETAAERSVRIEQQSKNKEV